MTASTSTTLPQPGDVFEDKYVIERVIGEGGMGIVYEARHRRLEQRVAIKMLLPALVPNSEIVVRFEREARASAQLRSRHSARVIDVGERADGLPFIVMEFLEGNDLATELEHRKTLPIVEAVDYVIEACEAMREAHDRGIVHRDLKPSNLFLAVEGKERIVKVLDFGISKVGGVSSRVTTTKMSMGTPLYMSPEQLRSTKSVDARSDIWALGIIVYELLAGVAPFEGDAAAVGAAIVAEPPPPLREHRPDVPKALEDVVLRALEKDREKRFPTVRDFARALSVFGTKKVDFSVPPAPILLRTPTADPSVNVEAATAPGWTFSDKGKPNHTVRNVAGAVLGIALIAVGAYFLMHGHEAPPPPVATSVSAPAPTPSTPPVATTEPAASTVPVVPSASATAPTATAHPTPRPTGKKNTTPTQPVTNPFRL